MNDAIGATYVDAAFYTTKDYSDRHRAIVRAFARIMSEAGRYCNAHPDASTKMMSEFTGIPRRVREDAAHTSVPTLPQQHFQAPIDAAARRAGLLKKAFPAADLIDANVAKPMRSNTMRTALGSRRRFLAALATISGSALSLRPEYACAQTTRPLTPIAVNITVSVDLLPFLYAIDQGMFAKAGLDVTYNVVSSGALSMVAVIGRAQHAGRLERSTCRPHRVCKNIPMQLIAPGAEYLSSAPQTEIFVTADSPLRGPKDLEGHTVGVSGLHDQSSIGVRAWVDGAGGDSTRVQFVEVPYSTMLAALDAKRVDAIVVFEPIRSAAIAAHERSLGKPFDAFSKRFLSGAFFATRTWIGQNREAAIRYGNVLRQSAEYCNAHYADLIPLISSYTKIAPEVVRRANPLKAAMRPKRSTASSTCPCGICGYPRPAPAGMRSSAVTAARVTGAIMSLAGQDKVRC